MSSSLARRQIAAQSAVSQTGEIGKDALFLVVKVLVIAAVTSMAQTPPVKPPLARTAYSLTRSLVCWMSALRLALFLPGVLGVVATPHVGSASPPEAAQFPLQVMADALGWKSKASAIWVHALPHASSLSGTLGQLAL